MNRLLCAVAALSALAFAACGEDDGADSAALEQQIKAQLGTSSASCPEDIGDDRFTCTVKWGNGASGKVEVTEQGKDRYAYAPVPGSVEVPGDVVEASLEDQLAKQGAANAEASCPSTIVVEVGTTVTCDLTGAGAKAGGTVTYTFSEADGTVDPSSVSASA